MGKARQKDYSKSACEARATVRTALLCAIAKRYRQDKKSAFSSVNCLAEEGASVHVEKMNLSMNLNRRNRISLTCFSFNFNRFSEAECLNWFRFRKGDIIRLVDVAAWPQAKRSTSRNQYHTSPLLRTCVILRRLASPGRWADLEEFFGKHGPQLSEIFWEGMERFLEVRRHLLFGDIYQEFIEAKAEKYASAIEKKGGGLNNCVGFIDGTVLGIARPKGSMAQRVVYNGHKRKHALKFQALNTHDKLILHMHGPVEGRRHDWTLYTQSGMDSLLPVVLDVNGKRFCVYTDSGYNRRWYLEAPFQGSNLKANQLEFNKTMYSVRITVEWIFKEVKLYYNAVDYKRKLKLFESL